MEPNVQRPITIAILAMGGEGGGVLAEWIVDVAEHAGYVAQMTSVPGVAQRTGATNYYVELFPKHGAKANSPAPVLGLTAMPGDVDDPLRQHAAAFAAHGEDGDGDRALCGCVHRVRPRRGGARCAAGRSR